MSSNNTSKKEEACCEISRAVERVDRELARLAALSRFCLNEACEILTELEHHADRGQQKRINKLFTTIMDGKGYWFPEDHDKQFWKERNK